MTSQYTQYIYDAETDLTDGEQNIIAPEDFQILDVGPAFCEGVMVIDVISVEVAGGTQQYSLILEGSNTASMASGSVALAAKFLGNPLPPMDQSAFAAGRYVVPFTNEENGVVYRYLRLSAKVAGTVAGTGLVCHAFLTKK